MSETPHLITPETIKLTQIRSDEDGVSHTSTVLLSSKLQEYLVRVGPNSKHVCNMMVLLLTEGKVRIHFRTYSERLELITPQDIVTEKALALQMLQNYIEKLRGTRPLLLDTAIEDHQHTYMRTQRIIVQKANWIKTDQPPS